MAEGNHVGAQLASNLVNCATAKAAAEVTTMIRLLIDQPQRRIVGLIEPVNAPLLQVRAERGYRTEEFALLHCECAHTELDRSPLLQETQRLEKRDGVLTTRETDCNAIPIPDHLEPADSLAYLPK